MVSQGSPFCKDVVSTDLSQWGPDIKPVGSHLYPQWVSHFFKVNQVFGVGGGRAGIGEAEKLKWPGLFPPLFLSPRNFHIGPSNIPLSLRVLMVRAKMLLGRLKLVSHDLPPHLTHPPSWFCVTMEAWIWSWAALSDVLLLLVPILAHGQVSSVSHTKFVCAVRTVHLLKSIF